MTEFGILFHTHVPEVMEVLLAKPMCATEMQTVLNLDQSGLQKALKILQIKGYTFRTEGRTARTPIRRTLVWNLTPKGRKAAVLIIGCRDALEAVE